MTDRKTTVQGRCPACRGASLFLGDGGHVTCARLECPNPSAADELLHGDRVGAGTPLVCSDERHAAKVANLERQLAALRAVARGYCPACGRGDAAPTVEDWEQQKQRADEAEQQLRLIDAMRQQNLDAAAAAIQRAERAEAAITRVRDVANTWFLAGEPGATRNAGKFLLRVLDKPAPPAATQATDNQEQPTS